MSTLESVLTVAIILGAAAFLVYKLRAVSKGEGGCGCGKCAKGCRTRSKFCLKGRES